MGETKQKKKTGGKVKKMMGGGKTSKNMAKMARGGKKSKYKAKGGKTSKNMAKMARGGKKSKYMSKMMREVARLSTWLKAAEDKWLEHQLGKEKRVSLNQEA